MTTRLLSFIVRNIPTEMHFRNLFGTHLLKPSYKTFYPTHLCSFGEATKRWARLTVWVFSNAFFDKEDREHVFHTMQLNT